MDPKRLGEWVTLHRSVGDDTPESLDEGSSFEQCLGLAGVPFHVRWTVTELDEPRHAAWEGAGPAGSKARVRYALEPANGSGTRFGYTNEFELPGGALARSVGRAVGRRRSRREAERSLAEPEAAARVRLLSRSGGRGRAAGISR